PPARERRVPARIRRDLAHPRRGVRGARLMKKGGWSVWAWRIGILVAFLGAWEYLTGIKAISKTPGLYWIDPFFISRPSVIAQRLLSLTSDKERRTIWQMALATIQSTLWGFLVGISTGFVAGLVLGRSDRI